MPIGKLSHFYKSIWAAVFSVKGFLATKTYYQSFFYCFKYILIVIKLFSILKNDAFVLF